MSSEESGGRVPQEPKECTNCGGETELKGACADNVFRPVCVDCMLQDDTGTTLGALHFITGLAAGSLALVVLWAMGLPSIYQISWGLAVAVLVWWRFDSGADGPDLEGVLTRD